MFGITDLVVGLWALPVTLCIITPLLILVVWLLARFAKSIITPIIARDSDGNLREILPPKLNKATSKP